MAARTEVEELRERVTELMFEVDRYRTACEDALQQVDWCIGYFVGSNKAGVARALGSNRSYIRRELLGRAAQPVPTGNDTREERSA